VLSTAWLSALDYVIGGIESVPGRKAVVVFSEGLDLFKDRMAGQQVWHGLRLGERAGSPERHPQRAVGSIAARLVRSGDEER
jgi:hypothetical protein